MEWMSRLKGQIVGLDTAPLIYFIEAHPVFRPQVRPFFDALSQGRFTAVTSSITLAEVLVHPLRHGALELAERYREILYDSAGLELISVSPEIAEKAAELRARHGLRTPDALQIATTLLAGAACFFTNDTRLPSVPGLEIITVKNT